MKWKKAVSCVLAGGLLAGMVTGCQKESEDGGADKPVSLEMATTWTGDKKDVLEKIVGEFTDETGIEVELVSPGDSYETVMKTRMASNDLPDLWETHGWSVARYSEYLMPLNDQEWMSRVDEAIKPVITDKEGNIFVLPLTMGINTISYSQDALRAAGVKAEDIRTWDDFEAACDQLKEKGITPIYVGNSDGTSIAQLAEAVPPTYLTNDDVEDNQGDALKDGTFDFETYWTPVAERIDSWMQKGYFNVDISTSDNEAGCRAVGLGEAGFIFGGSNNITTARTYNPEAEMGILPAPGLTDDAKSSLSMGEGSCYGVWKDSENRDEALQLLEYLSDKEIVSELATAGGDLPAFTDADNSEDYLTKVFRKTTEDFDGDLLYVPLFDREYLPNGMWDDLGNSLTEIILSPGNAVESSTASLAAAYQEKLTAGE